MDSLITAAARALSAGDALGALKRVALRDDPAALALRGIAMAQLGEHLRARELLRSAARGFGAHEEVYRARCVVAEAEVALAMRDFRGSLRSLASAAATLEVHGERANASHATLIVARRLLLLGRLREAATALSAIDARSLPSAQSAVAELITADLALRSLHTAEARDALSRAQRAAERARVPALLAEVTAVFTALDRPAARRILAGGEQFLRLEAVEVLLGSEAMVIDACRRGISAGAHWLPLARRPVLFALARALGEAWPGDVDRQDLIVRVFNTRRPDDTHRARLRVEVGRLRAVLATIAKIESTQRGFVLVPHDDRAVAVIAPPIDGEEASLIALLADGAPWSTSALAFALGISQRSVQRALIDLESDGRVRSIGLARAKRWLTAPLVQFTTILLLPNGLPLA